MLFRAGAVRKLGSVNAGDSHLDFHTLEQQRGITIYSKQATIVHKGVELTLIDTPGHVDFSSEAERTLQILDYAVLVIDASEGVRGHTETLWRLLERYHVPTFVFANKMDLAERSWERILEELSERLSDACVDWSNATIVHNEDESTEVLIPPDLAESCAAADEQALEEFFDTDAISIDTMRRLIAQRAVFPCLFGSALKDDGIERLSDMLSCLTQEKSHPEQFGAHVFKISHDPAGTRLTWLKVTGGELRVKQLIEQPLDTNSVRPKPNAANGTISEKVDQIRCYIGAKYETATCCEAGRICAVSGLSQTQAGMLLGNEAAVEKQAQDAESQNDHGTPGGHAGDDQPGRNPVGRRDDATQPSIVPTFACSVIPQGCDVQAVYNALKLLNDEDPLLCARWDEQLQEIHVQVMGTIQLEVLQATLHDRFGLDVEFGPGSVVHRETIDEPVVGIGHFEPLRHYAEVHLLIEPLPAGSGVQFGTRCHVDDLDLNWQRLILTNAREREHRGVLVGAPITDVRITLIGGRAHNKHTEGGDFRQATYRAIRQGLMQAKSTLLEPWNRFALRVPTEQVGRAFSDLQRMGARYDAPLTSGDFALIEGIVPAKEIRDYTLQVSSYTHGMGSLSLEFHGYEPCHDAESVIAEIGYEPEADLANTPDSVFCSHGAGHTVKWDEVAQAAHVKPDPSRFTDWREATPEWFG